MNRMLRILLALLCAAAILSMPFVVSSPTLLSEKALEIMDNAGTEEDSAEEGRLLDLFVSAAHAEEDLIVEEVEEGAFSGSAEWELPLDFTPAPAPNEDAYTDNGYEDESIRVSVETEEEGGVTWHIARVQIASPTQIRTGIAGEKVTSKRTRTVSSMVRMYNAVIGISGDDFVMDPVKTSFEYRMGQKIRSKTNKTKDILIIDRNGDFHLYIKSRGITIDKKKKVTAEGLEGEILNAFTFGPALVKDGELLEMDTGYGYNPNGHEPRAAIGQTGRLSYVLVIAEGRGESSGVNHQELARKMFDLGCVQAFNLDGGNSAEMVFRDRIYKGMPGGDERALSDFIYFASAVPENR